MSLTPEQTAELAKPLDRAAVKTREQSGRKLSYVEGWHAIAEANRIFGFDGWSRETIDIKCVAEHAREIGQRKDPGHGVSYIAKVRVNVGGIVREGCGTGHGIDRDLGQAHESALKEAETDAMKRALMTFGNPFGLALYDKTQAEVADVPKRAPRQAVAREDGPREATVRKLAEPLVQASGIICGEGEFWKYLGVTNADSAAQIVRDRCKIKSRSELATNSDAARLWRELVAGYRAWQREQAISNTPRRLGEDAATTDPPAGGQAPLGPAGGEVIPTAAVYSDLWNSILNAAVPSKRAMIGKTWNEQKALRNSIEWTPTHPFLPLRQRVEAVLEQLKEPV